MTHAFIKLLSTFFPNQPTLQKLKYINKRLTLGENRLTSFNDPILHPKHNPVCSRQDNLQVLHIKGKIIKEAI